MPKELNGKMKAFCDAYLKDFNATQAAITAGYTNNKHTHIQAYKRLQSVTVQKYLSKQTQKQCKKAEISIEWIIQELKEIYRRCTEGRLEGKTAVRSLELMGKYLGMWIEKHQIVNDDLHITVDFKNEKK